jgi:hypothetical protein
VGGEEMTLGYSPNLEAVQAYYERTDVNREILRHARDRSIVMPHRRGFNDRERVDVKAAEDIPRLAQRGVALRLGSTVPTLYPSFHGSIRKADGICDMVFEIDMKQSYKRTFRSGSLLLRVFDKFDLPYLIKFSGNTSPHIIIPGEAFPEYAQGDSFPLVAAAVHSYLQEKTRVSMDGSFASGEHFLRLPYSLNENTGLASIPIEHEEFHDFDPSRAEMDQVEVRTGWWKVSREGRSMLEDFISLVVGESRGRPGMAGLGFMEPLGDEGHLPAWRAAPDRFPGVDRMMGRDLGRLQEDLAVQMEDLGARIQRDVDSLQKRMGRVGRRGGRVFEDREPDEDEYEKEEEEDSRRRGRR